MSLVPRQMYRGAPGVTLTTLYTAPERGYALIKSILLCNTTNEAKTVTLYTVDNGEVPNDGDAFLMGNLVEAATTTVVEVNLILESEMQLKGFQEAAGVITVTASGVEG